ncbi:MAG TPA: MFS transporter [Candidatus Limnocylindrales bacterium]
MTGLERVGHPFERVARLPILSPLAVHDVRLVWFGEGVSLVGDAFQLVALSWLVLGLTGSGLALGTILVATAIPRGVFMLLGGVLADRVSPRDLALGSNVLRAVLTTIVAGLVIGGGVQIWHLALVGALFGTVDAVFLPAINTLVPRLVPAGRLPAANAIMEGTRQLVGTVGPALAGFAVALIGVGPAYVIDAVSFAVAALALWYVRSGAAARAAAPAAAGATSVVDPSRLHGGTRPSMAAALIEGVRAVLGDPALRSIVIISTAANLAFTGPTTVGLPWLVLVHFGADAFALGLLFAAFGAGSLGGVILAGSLRRPRRFGWLVLSLLLAMGVGLGAIGLASSITAIAFISVVIGTMNGYVNVVIISWVQEKTEPHLLGRTMSFMMLGSVVSAPLSIALAAFAVDTHATAMFLVAGALVVVSGLVAIASGLPRRLA